jgi:hypothetical protein
MARAAGDDDAHDAAPSVSFGVWQGVGGASTYGLRRFCGRPIIGRSPVERTR